MSDSTIVALYDKCSNSGAFDICCLRYDDGCCKSINSYKKDQDELNSFINFINNELSNDILKFQIGVDNTRKYDVYEAYEHYIKFMENNIYKYALNWLVSKNDINENEKKNDGDKIKKIVYEKIKKYKYIERYIKNKPYTEENITLRNIRSISEKSNRVDHLININFQNQCIIINIDNEKDKFEYNPNNYENKITIINNENIPNGQQIKVSKERYDIIKKTIEYSMDNECSIDLALLHVIKRTFDEWKNIFHHMLLIDTYAKFMQYKSLEINDKLGIKISGKRAFANCICLMLLFIIVIIAIIVGLYIVIKTSIN